MISISYDFWSDQHHSKKDVIPRLLYGDSMYSQGCQEAQGLETALQG